MFLHWLYITWKYFWRTVLVLLVIALLGGLTVFGVLQLDSSQKYVANQIENQFNNRFRGKLSVGDVDGVLPFRMELIDVTLAHSKSPKKDIDSLSSRNIASFSRLHTQIDIWSLLQNKLSINDLKIEDPAIRFIADSTGEKYTIASALQPGADAQKRVKKEGGRWIERVEIVAPAVEVQNGSIYIESFLGDSIPGNIPEPFNVRSVNTRMFLELSEYQRFLDFEYFSADMPGLAIREVNFSGQIYSDRRFLEFNAFNIATTNSEITVSGQIDGLDINEGNFAGQLPEARYEVDVKSSNFSLSEIRTLLPYLPDIKPDFTFSLTANGDVDSLWIDEFTFGIGDSFLGADGLVRNLNRRGELDYKLDINESLVNESDLNELKRIKIAPEYQVFESLRIDGDVNGTVDSVNVNLDMVTDEGRLVLKGFAELEEPYRHNASLSVSNLNIAPYTNGRVDSTDLNFSATIDGIGYDLREDIQNLTFSIYDSHFDGLLIDKLEANASLINGFLEHSYSYESGEEIVKGSGWIDLTEEENIYALEGDAIHLNLAKYPFVKLPPTDLNMSFDVEVQGASLERVSGRANIDIRRSAIDGDTVRAHQAYVDLDSPDLDSRTLRMTSSIADLTVQGDIEPKNLLNQFRYWKSNLARKVNREVFYRDSVAVDTSAITTTPVSLNGRLVTKELELIRGYLPEFPRVDLKSTLNFDVKADSNRILLTADSDIDSLKYRANEIREGSAKLTASFRHDRAIKDFGTLDFETEFDSVKTAFLKLKNIATDFSLKRDSLTFDQEVGQISRNASSRINLNGKLSEEGISIFVDDFLLGNEIYLWRNSGVPEIHLKENDEIEFVDFKFQNNEELLSIEGTISDKSSDSLALNLKKINLDRISELIDGRVSFDGLLNGKLITQALMSTPTVQGELNVNRLEIDDRLVGDARFRSRFNQEKDRFDTRISVVTDSLKYDDYLDDNDDIGQRIFLDGYVNTPRRGVRQDTLFHFDTDFKEIDLWVVNKLAHKVFQQVEGSATGSGYLVGNFEDYDFHVEFDVNNAFAKTEFLNTNYFVDGRVIFDRQNWIVLDSLSISDTKGGSGILYGNVDLNDFNPINNIDIGMDLNNLHFLNNTYDPDVPFYGSLSGSGKIRITGPNNNMFLQTIEPIRVTTDSRLSIPLLEQTELNESTKFISFVNSFDVDAKRSESVLANGAAEQPDRETVNKLLENLTFSERFNLDLQFIADEPTNVQLVFDQVTGEVLTAQGTGNLRITMAEEEMQMFGRYTIDDGTYQFVGGEILTRKLELESGGTIIWEGDAENARLDIKAVYRARPNIALLTANGATSQEDISDGQRVPIDLIVEITGTISSVENNYYFRVPGTFDISSNTTLNTRINELNRDEQEKLIQATSILLTGDFIAYSDVNEASANITQSFTRGSTYLNPLLSSQIISPLLSNQINALLNSDVSRLDVDFSLNTYNEIDLGVALRLYNDRLILRREGPITSSNTNESITERIGDINATYRINRGLSLTAFHRQDQSLNEVTPDPSASDVTATVDGIGLEAQVKFNTWREITRRIKNTFLGIFGLGKDKKEKDEDEKLASDDAIAKDGDEAADEKEEN